MPKVTNNIIFDNCRIGFRNFSGREGKFNPPGKKNFCVFIDDNAFARQLENDGWNIRYLAPRNDGEEEQALLNVGVSYDPYPPTIFLLTSTQKTLLDDTTVSMLDWAEIKNVDLVVRPYNYEVNGRSGVKAYCKSMYVTIVEDEFADKYRDIPLSNEPAPVISED